MDEKEAISRLTNNLTERFYFHGTSKEYLERQIIDYEKYQHENYGMKDNIFHDPVQISTGFDHSRKYAIDRSTVLFKGRIPVVIKIKAESVNERLRLHPCSSALALDYVLAEEFEKIFV